MTKAFKKLHKLQKVLNSHSGGSVSFKDFKDFEHFKPSSPVLYYRETFNENDGYERKVIILLTERKLRLPK